jgi:hypothetical protein
MEDWVDRDVTIAAGAISELMTDLLEEAKPNISAGKWKVLEKQITEHEADLDQAEGYLDNKPDSLDGIDNLIDRLEWSKLGVYK